MTAHRFVGRGARMVRSGFWCEVESCRIMLQNQWVTLPRGSQRRCAHGSCRSQIDAWPGNFDPALASISDFRSHPDP